MVCQVKDSLRTKALTPKEVLRVPHEGDWRVWDPTRSKLAAALKKGYQLPPLQGCTVLYLGAAHGYTPSFISDEVGRNGFVLCVEKSKVPMKQLLRVCTTRTNMAPLLADANHPELYPKEIRSFDVLYQDIAQKNQASIFLKNFPLVKNGGLGFFAIKAKAIDTVAPSKKTIQHVHDTISKEYTVLDCIFLEPYELDHAMLVVRKTKEYTKHKRT